MRLWLICIIFLFPSMVSQAATTSYTCKFQLYASSKGLAKEVTPMELRFVSDPEAKKVYLIGNNGSSEVHTIANKGGVSFLEVTGTGNVMVTTITSAGDAVLSRNSIILGDLIPTQYYGKCNIQ